MAAPSSAQTSPSQTANTAPKIQPSIACGPPMAEMINGIVMNGPTPIMSVMFSAVALTTPTPRMSGSDSRGGTGASGFTGEDDSLSRGFVGSRNGAPESRPARGRAASGGDAPLLHLESRRQPVRQLAKHRGGDAAALERGIAGRLAARVGHEEMIQSRKEIDGDVAIAPRPERRRELPSLLRSHLMIRGALQDQDGDLHPAC